MAEAKKILLVDDRVGDISWLIDILESRNYDVERLTNEEEAMEKLDGIKAEEMPYALAIIDIMVSVKDILNLVDVSGELYRESRRTGVRLCRYIRQDLGISDKELPIVCISARADDEEIRKELRSLGIDLFSRVPQRSEDSLRDNLDRYLPNADEGQA